MYFQLFRFESLRKSRRIALEQTWPANFFVRRTATYLKTPLHRGEFPAISVVMSAYNAADYLRESIDSIVSQTFGDWEFIIIDDGSTDDTLSILREYESRDKRFRIISRPNTGLTKALNEGVAAARGEFIARMDADDIAMPAAIRDADRVSAIASRLRVAGRTDRVDRSAGIEDRAGQSQAEPRRDRRRTARGQGRLGGASGLHDARGCRPEDRRVSEHYNNSEDLDLFLRLAEVGRIANLPDLLLKYRRHPESVSHQKYENQWKLKKQIVAEAYERRGMKMPADWTFVAVEAQAGRGAASRMGVGGAEGRKDQRREKARDERV